MNNIKLQKVYYMPSELEPGILYVSDEFGVAIHLCPCNCGSRVVTTIGPTEWSFKESNNKPTLYPSIGNWQLPCKSHYWITNGEIEWSYRWSDERIKDGRIAEEKRRREYYSDVEENSKKSSFIKRFFNFIFKR